MIENKPIQWSNTVTGFYQISLLTYIILFYIYFYNFLEYSVSGELSIKSTSISHLCHLIIKIISASVQQPQMASGYCHLAPLDGATLTCLWCCQTGPEFWQWRCPLAPVTKRLTVKILVKYLNTNEEMKNRPRSEREDRVDGMVTWRCW